MALGNDCDFHTVNYCLFWGMYRTHQVSSRDNLSEKVCIVICCVPVLITDPHAIYHCSWVG